MFKKLNHEAKTKKSLTETGGVTGPHEVYAQTISNAQFSKDCLEKRTHHYPQPPKSALGLAAPPQIQNLEYLIGLG